jgi:hypothetical protein
MNARLAGWLIALAFSAVFWAAVALIVWLIVKG